MAKSINVKIKVTELNDTKLGQSAAKEIKGVEIETGKEWARKFFSNDKGLREQYNEIGIGDTVVCTLEQEGKFWNLKNIEEVPAEEPKVKTTVVGSSGLGGLRRSDGGSRGDDTNRSAAIYLAQEIVAMMGVTYGDGVDQLASEIVNVADKYIYPYIKDGVVPEMKAKAKKAKKDDPLSPPEIE